MSRRCYTSTLILLATLVAVCSGFHVIVPSGIQKTQTVSVTSFRPAALFAAEGTDTDNKAKTDDSESTTDIEVPKFDAKDFEEDSGPAFDWFTVVLVAYIIFAIVDTAFHITPDTPYIQMIMQGITGSGGGGDASS